MGAGYSFILNSMSTKSLSVSISKNLLLIFIHKVSWINWLTTLTCQLSKYTRLTFWDIFVTLLSLFATYSLNFLITFFHPTHLLYVLPTIFLVKYLPNNRIGTSFQNVVTSFYILGRIVQKSRVIYLNLGFRMLTHLTFFENFSTLLT